MFFQPQYLQDVRGHSAVLSGLLILPITAPMIFISPFSGRLIAPLRRPAADDGGHGLRDRSACSSLTQIGADSSYALLLAGYLLFGIALGLVYAPMSTAAMAAMPAEKVGIASGVLAMDRVMAGSLALAATGAVFHALHGERRLLRRRGRRLDLGPRSPSARSAPGSPGRSCAIPGDPVPIRQWQASPAAQHRTSAITTASPERFRPLSDRSA